MDAQPARPTPAAPTGVGTLWNQFAAPLRSFVAKRAPREVDAEDVLQDVFVRIQAQLASLRDTERIDAWVFQIARNVVADAYRSRTRRDALDARTTAEDLAPFADDDERDSEASLVSCLASLIAQLPGSYRQAIELTEIRGMTQGEAARLVGVSLSGMKSRVQRGREQLKAIIHDGCRVETDVRGRVIECDPRRPHDCGERLRPSPRSDDSMGMESTNPLPPAQSPSTLITPEAAPTGCCGGAAPKDSNACCARDAEVKATGGSGCGCGSKPATTANKGCC